MSSTYDWVDCRFVCILLMGLLESCSSKYSLPFFFDQNYKKSELDQIRSISLVCSQCPHRGEYIYVHIFLQIFPVTHACEIIGKMLCLQIILDENGFQFYFTLLLIYMFPSYTLVRSCIQYWHLMHTYIYCLSDNTWLKSGLKMCDI